MSQGHNKPITVLSLSPDHKTIFTGSHDGIVTSWNSETGENDRVEGNGHGNQMNGMKALSEFVFTCGIDDKLKEIDIINNSYSPFEVKLGAQPRGMDVNGDTAITVTVKEVRGKHECLISFENVW
mgnify:CR=1 FL=1